MKKFAYIRLNRKMPCPPRCAVLVNQAHGGGLSLFLHNSLSVMEWTRNLVRLPHRSDVKSGVVVWQRIDNDKMKGNV